MGHSTHSVFFAKISVALADHASGSIWPSIIMHAIINSIGFFILLFVEMITASVDLDLAEVAEINRTQDNTMLIAGLVLLVISIGFSFLIKRVLRKIAISENNLEVIGGNEKE